MSVTKLVPMYEHVTARVLSSQFVSVIGQNLLQLKQV
jgi:hypothetical protein